MTLRHVALIGALSLLGCSETEVGTGGSCPTCSGGVATTVAAACAEKTRSLASTRSGGGGSGGGGGTPTTFAAPTNVNVNTPPSSSIAINCGSGTTP